MTGFTDENRVNEEWHGLISRLLRASISIPQKITKKIREWRKKRLTFLWIFILQWRFYLMLLNKFNHMYILLIIFMSRFCFPGQLHGKWSVSEDLADKHQCKGKCLCFGLSLCTVSVDLSQFNNNACDWKKVCFHGKNNVFHVQDTVHWFCNI